MKTRNEEVNGYYCKPRRIIVILNAKNSDESNNKGDDSIDLDIVKDLIRSSGSSSDLDGGDGDDAMFEKVYVGDGGSFDDLDEATRLELEEGRPSEWMIMKEVCVCMGRCKLPFCVPDRIIDRFDDCLLSSVRHVVVGCIPVFGIIFCA